MSAAPWGRGAGEGIGLSGHKNEYQGGVRISNWVEEQFGAEAVFNNTSMKEFSKAEEQAQMAASIAQREPARSMRVEPNLGVSSATLFSHGRTFNENYQASMSALHYTDPAARTYGAKSNDRVHKSFFYGSKLIDVYVPKNDPNPRQSLTAVKQAEWATQTAPQAPTGQDMYMTSSKSSYR